MTAKAVTRPLGQLGGEEFAMVLNGAGRENGLAFAERIEAAAIDMEGRPVGASVSIGMGGVRRRPLRPGELLAQADEALYCAKERGHNRVEVASLDLIMQRAREAMGPARVAAPSAA
jgi:diguanylate cyclase (GGDEF)-like protein